MQKPSLINIKPFFILPGMIRLLSSERIISQQTIVLEYLDFIRDYFIQWIFNSLKSCSFYYLLLKVASCSAFTEFLWPVNWVAFVTADPGQTSNLKDNNFLESFFCQQVTTSTNRRFKGKCWRLFYSTSTSNKSKQVTIHHGLNRIYGWILKSFVNHRVSSSYCPFNSSITCPVIKDGQNLNYLIVN